MSGLATLDEGGHAFGKVPLPSRHLVDWFCSSVDSELVRLLGVLVLEGCLLVTRPLLVEQGMVRPHLLLVQK